MKNKDLAETDPNSFEKFKNRKRDKFKKKKYKNKKAYVEDQESKKWN